MANFATNLKKGDTVIIHMFTGIAVGVKEVIAADKTTVTLETRAGRAKFSRKTGKQIEPAAKQERFANYITEDDGSFVPKSEQKKTTKKKAAPKKAATKKKPEPEPDEDEIEEDDFEEIEEEKPAPKKRRKARKPATDEDDE